MATPTPETIWVRGDTRSRFGSGELMRDTNPVVTLFQHQTAAMAEMSPHSQKPPDRSPPVRDICVQLRALKAFGIRLKCESGHYR